MRCCKYIYIYGSVELYIKYYDSHADYKENPVDKGGLVFVSAIETIKSTKGFFSTSSPLVFMQPPGGSVSWIDGARSVS